MSKRVDWFKGPVCGIENCKSTWYYKDAGKTICKRGHEQEVTMHQVSHTRIQYLTIITRAFKPSKMTTNSAHKVERPASERRLKKRSHEVQPAHPPTLPTLTFTSSSWPLCCRALSPSLPAYPLETMPCSHQYHWPTSRTGKRCEGSLGATTSIVERKDRCDSG